MNIPDSATIMLRLPHTQVNVILRALSELKLGEALETFLNVKQQGDLQMQQVARQALAVEGVKKPTLVPSPEEVEAAAVDIGA